VSEARGGAGTLIEWAVATRTLPGQPESGDLHLVKTVGPDALVAVVDGLGHGAEAAAVARAAVAALDADATGPVPRLFERCHRALAGTRGAVLSLALFTRQERSMTWLGVGNVMGVFLCADPAARPARVGLISRGGIVGSRLPPLEPRTLPVAPGDTLIFATDGIEGAADGLPSDASPQALADQILAHGATGRDDALVLVARYVGAATGAASGAGAARAARAERQR
jgi:phosphoserine phosphatase RsbX